MFILKLVKACFLLLAGWPFCRHNSCENLFFYLKGLEILMKAVFDPDDFVAKSSS